MNCTRTHTLCTTSWQPLYQMCTLSNYFSHFSVRPKTRQRAPARNEIMPTSFFRDFHSPFFPLRCQRRKFASATTFLQTASAAEQEECRGPLLTFDRQTDGRYREANTRAPPSLHTEHTRQHADKHLSQQFQLEREERERREERGEREEREERQ